MTPRAAPLDRQAGLSLLELVVVMALIGVLMALVSQPLQRALATRQTLGEIQSREDALRHAAQRLSRDLRSLAPPGEPASPVPPRLDVSPWVSSGTTSPGLCLRRLQGSQATVRTVVVGSVDGALHIAVAGDSDPCDASPGDLLLATGKVSFRFFGRATDSGPLEAMTVDGPDFPRKVRVVQWEMSTPDPQSIESNIVLRGDILLRSNAWGEDLR